MKLNTYRCGCGRIETLPHPKARPGPCTHVKRPRLVEATAWRPAMHATWPHAPGWNVEERTVLGCDGDPRSELRARKPGRRDLRFRYARENKRGQALDMLAGLARKADTLRTKAEGFFTALRGLIRGIRAATVNQRWPEPGGMRPWAKSLPDTVGPIPYSIVGAACPAPYGTTVKPFNCSAPPMSPEVEAAIRAGAKVSVPRETPDGRWVCDVEAPPICRWRTDVRGADQLRYTKAAQMYAEGLQQHGLGAYVLTTVLATKVSGVDVVRVAFDTEEMEDIWVDAVNYRLDLVDRIQTATGVALGHLLDVPGKRPAWFPADV